VDERLRCRHCDDVIGAYEPMIVVTEHGYRESSRLREGAPLARIADDCYHAACFPGWPLSDDG